MSRSALFPPLLDVVPDFIGCIAGSPPVLGNANELSELLLGGALNDVK